jgi:hypothetical protein
VPKSTRATRSGTASKATPVAISIAEDSIIVVLVFIAYSRTDSVSTHPDCPERGFDRV